MPAAPRFWVLGSLLAAASAATFTGAFSNGDHRRMADEPTWHIQDVQLYAPLHEFKLPPEAAALAQGEVDQSSCWQYLLGAK